MLNSNEILYGTFPSSRRFSSTHNGIDLACPNNTGVKSRFAGVVKVTGTNPPGQDFGNYIRIYHPSLGISSWYAHLLSFGVKVGQNVSQGQLIGQSNNTGLSTGPHLHYSESKGETTQWINPDTTQGGEVMASRDFVKAVFNDLLERDPEEGAYTTYTPQPADQVLYQVRFSPERAALQARKAQELNTLRSQVDTLTKDRDLNLYPTIEAQKAQIVELQTTLGQQQAQVKELENQVAQLKAQLGSLPGNPVELGIATLLCAWS